MYLKICINAAWVNTGWVPNVHDNLSPLPAQEHSSPTPSNLCSALERELSASELINIMAIHYLITGLSPLHFLMFVSFFFFWVQHFYFSLLFTQSISSNICWHIEWPNQGDIRYYDYSFIFLCQTWSLSNVKSWKYKTL